MTLQANILLSRVQTKQKILNFRAQFSSFYSKLQFLFTDMRNNMLSKASSPLIICILLMSLGTHAQTTDIGCFVSGECAEGLVSGLSVQDSVGACVDFCAETPGCQYFSYSPGDNVCLALDQCPQVSAENCPDCVSGDSSCPNQLCELEGR